MVKLFKKITFWKQYQVWEKQIISEKRDAYGCKSNFLSWKTKYMMEMEKMPYIKKDN